MLLEKIQEISNYYQQVKLLSVVNCTCIQTWGAVKGGIPQGSAPGPLLFLIFVNNIPIHVQHGALLQFADDN